MSTKAAEFAAVDFEPIAELAKLPPPSNAEWADLANPYLVTMRLAWRLTQMTKPEVVEAIRGISDHESAGQQMVDAFEDTLAFFEGWLEVLKAGEARILCAGSVLIVEHDQAKQ